MRNVVVITTGGTIASASDEDGAKVVSASGTTLLDSLPETRGTAVRVVDLMKVNSYTLDFAHMDLINGAVANALADSSTSGVVVTHGTDTLEESAMLVDLFHQDSRPVVFTGAQLGFDDPAADGPRNLADAIAAAASSEAHDLGVLVCFAGVLHAARGARKVHTTARSAFFDADHGPVGTVDDDGTVRVHTRTDREGTGLDAPVPIADIRVDIVALYPGVDEAALESNVGRGARGIVLQATGSGNSNAEIVEAVRACTQDGVPVILSSRVPAGVIGAVYGGGGGGVDLVAAGAIPATLLRPSQARILLAALISAGRSRDQIISAFAAQPSRRLDTHAPVPHEDWKMP
jgi:L-asparaginase